MKVATALILFQCFITIASGQRLTVSIHSIAGYSPYDSFAYKAARALETVLNADEFKNRVITGKFRRTNGLSNQELYETIMRAHEVEGPGGADSVADLRLRTINLEDDSQRWLDNCQIGSFAGTIGIDGAGSGIFATCRTWLEKWQTENNVAELSGHYAHEYMHLLGFNHHRFLFGGQRWRKKTFVYQIGNIVTELVEKIDLTTLKR